MNGIIYIVGLVVVVVALLSFFGLRSGLRISRPQNIEASEYRGVSKSRPLSRAHDSVPDGFSCRVFGRAEIG